MTILETPIALDRAGGDGICIGEDALQEADIIVSTTRAAASRVIQVGTVAPVSHAALYVGGGEVVEAIGEGVVRRVLEIALANDVLAVAYRYPKMTSEISARIVRYATARAIAKVPDSVSGALLSPDKILCRVMGPRPASFFYFQLVVESYRQSGVPLTSRPSQCVTPKDVAVIARDQLTYVGHLLGSSTWFPVMAP